MLSYVDIIQLNKITTSRPLSEGAIAYLADGCQKYASQGMQHLGHNPTKDEAETMIAKVLSALDNGDGPITLDEVVAACDKLPFPFNLWLC